MIFKGFCPPSAKVTISGADELFFRFQEGMVVSISLTDGHTKTLDFLYHSPFSAISTISTILTIPTISTVLTVSKVSTQNTEHR